MTSVNKLCNDCILKCTKCIKGCKSIKDPKMKKEMKECIKSCMICIELCKVVCKCLCLDCDKVLLSSIKRSCRLACKKCATECSKHNMKFCQICTESCGKCVKSL